MPTRNTYQCATDLSDVENRLVDIDGNGKIVLASSGGTVLGVLKGAGGAVDDWVSVVEVGSAFVEAAAPIAAGRMISSDAYGRARAAQTGDYAAGRINEAATSAGDKIGATIEHLGDVLRDTDAAGRVVFAFSHAVPASASASVPFCAPLLFDGSPELTIDGSGTARLFAFTAVEVPHQIDVIRFVVTARALLIDGGTFGSDGGLLTSGVRLTHTRGGKKTELGNFTQNEDLFALARFFAPTSGMELLTAALSFEGGLILDPRDSVEVEIRDDLAAKVRGLSIFRAFVDGRR